MEVKRRSFFEVFPKFLITLCIIIMIIGLIITEVFIVPEQKKVMRDYLSEQNIVSFQMRHVKNNKGSYIIKDEKNGNFYYFKINAKWRFQIGEVTEFEKIDKKTVDKIMDWD